MSTKKTAAKVQPGMLSRGFSWAKKNLLPSVIDGATQFGLNYAVGGGAGGQESIPATPNGVQQAPGMQPGRQGIPSGTAAWSSKPLRPQRQMIHTASYDRALAFEHGVEQFCKASGFDEEDRLAMFALIEKQARGPLTRRPAAGARTGMDPAVRMPMRRPRPAAEPAPRSSMIPSLSDTAGWGALGAAGYAGYKGLSNQNRYGTWMRPNWATPEYDQAQDELKSTREDGMREDMLKNTKMQTLRLKAQRGDPQAKAQLEAEQQKHQSTSMAPGANPSEEAGRLSRSTAEERYKQLVTGGNWDPDEAWHQAAIVEGHMGPQTARKLHPEIYGPKPNTNELGALQPPTTKPLASYNKPPAAPPPAAAAPAPTAPPAPTPAAPKPQAAPLYGYKPPVSWPAQKTAGMFDAVSDWFSGQGAVKSMPPTKAPAMNSVDLAGGQGPNHEILTPGQQAAQSFKPTTARDQANVSTPMIHENVPGASPPPTAATPPAPTSSTSTTATSMTQPPPAAPATKAPLAKPGGKAMFTPSAADQPKNPGMPAGGQAPAAAKPAAPPAVPGGVAAGGNQEQPIASADQIAASKSRVLANQGKVNTPEYGFGKVNLNAPGKALMQSKPVTETERQSVDPGYGGKPRGIYMGQQSIDSYNSSNGGGADEMRVDPETGRVLDYDKRLTLYGGGTKKGSARPLAPYAS